MRHYLATLHTRSPKHKKHFALLTSAAITLTIFTIWSVVNFGNFSTAVTATNANEIGPFESLRLGVATAVKAVGGFSKVKEEVNIETVPTYGR